jgi:hypothetical protein
LAFIYADKEYFDSNRILCMAKFLFEVEQKNRLEQRGLLKRFSISCYGKQPTLESIRAEKAEKFKELVHNRNSAEWNAWFFKYSPGAAVALGKNIRGKRLSKSFSRKSKTSAVSTTSLSSPASSSVPVYNASAAVSLSRKKTQKIYKNNKSRGEPRGDSRPESKKSKTRNVLQKLLGL